MTNMTSHKHNLYEQTRDECIHCSHCSEIFAEEVYKQKCDQVFDECWKYDKCVGCSFLNDPNAFCKKYLLYSIPADQLDDILNKFKEMKS